MATPGVSGALFRPKLTDSFPNCSKPAGTVGRRHQTCCPSPSMSRAGLRTSQFALDRRIRRMAVQPAWAYERGRKPNKKLSMRCWIIACADGLNAEFYSPPISVRVDYLREMISSGAVPIFWLSDGGAPPKFFTALRSKQPP